MMWEPTPFDPDLNLFDDEFCPFDIEVPKHLKVYEKHIVINRKESHEKPQLEAYMILLWENFLDTQAELDVRLRSFKWWAKSPIWQPKHVMGWCAWASKNKWIELHTHKHKI